MLGILGSKEKAVAVSATGRFLVRSPTECDVYVCDRKTTTNVRPLRLKGPGRGDHKAKIECFVMGSHQILPGL